LQAQLAQAGYYGAKGDYVPGRFDAKTQDALKEMLKDYEGAAISNKIPMTISEFVSQNAAATQAAGATAGKTPAEPSYQVTDPASIRAAAMAAFQQATGVGPSSSQLDEFVSRFQASQLGAEQASGPGRVSTQPDLSTAAGEYAQQAAPGAYKQNQVDAFQNALVNLFAPPESQRANIAPTPAA
jgi:hypothetical protein